MEALQLGREYNNPLLLIVAFVGCPFTCSQIFHLAHVYSAKRMYDSARPITALQCLYEGQTVKAWRGPYLGAGDINGSDWMPVSFVHAFVFVFAWQKRNLLLIAFFVHSQMDHTQYQDSTFVTPPFAEFVSGHSTFSAASAFVLRSFFGSDEYGGSYTIKAGESKFEPRIDDPSNPKFVDGLTNVPNQGPGTVGYVPSADIVLSWPTFTAAAEEAGYSRLVGGIHIAAGNEGGLELGYMVGEAVWKRYQGLLDNSSSSGRRKLHSENQKSNIRGATTSRA
jgi:PAP2 superfamily